MWTNSRHARKAAVATAVVLCLACIANLCLIAWVADLPVTVFSQSPLRATLLSLWTGVVLYGAAVLILVAPAWRRQVASDRQA